LIGKFLFAEVFVFLSRENYMKLVSVLMSLMFALLMGAHSTAMAARAVAVTDLGPISTNTVKPHTAADVRKAIIAGAATHQWTVQSETPGTIELKLRARRDSVELVLDVNYDANSYSIKYVSSEGLKYNKERNTIHAVYARWLNNLTAAINTQLTLM
jgi:hypothetical protein